MQKGGGVSIYSLIMMGKKIIHDQYLFYTHKKNRKKKLYFDDHPPENLTKKILRNALK